MVLLGPFLTQEYYRKLLNCFIGEFEEAKLLDIDLLQGLVQLVQCAGHEYLQPDDLVRILVVLRTRLQDTHQQTTNHPCYLTLALSRLLDVMVDGKVQDLSRIVDHEPLSSLLDQLMESSNPYLKHLASYAHQGLLHVPNDETSRQFVLQHAGNIAMGLLGIVSVCNLDLNGFSEESRKLCDATVSALEIGTEVVGGARTLYKSGQGISASVKGGIFSGARLIWYTALREAQEHIQNGRLSNFNRLVFEAPCSGDVEFQWGVCQLVGEVAVDPRWEVSTRQYATELLAELYRNNLNKDLDIWILQIIRQVVTYSDAATSSHSQLLLQSLDKKGDIGNKPFTAMMQRLEEPQSALYIPPQAKPTLQSPDDTLFPLMEKTLAFLMGSGQVLLLLGDSGGGKSTFNLQLEHTLWKDYKRGGAIPIHINLPAIDNPQQDMIAKQLPQLHLFSEAQIQELRQSRQFIVICDGYDECQLKKNLYDTNHLNKPGQWTAKMVISCRSQYLGIDYHSYFQPTGDRYQQAVGAMFQMAVIASFSRSQIEQYVEQYVQQVPQHAVYPMQISWTVKDYMDKLLRIPKLIELVSNPFLLTLALRAVTRVVGSGQDLSSIRLSRVGLYDNFITQWLESEKLRLVASTLSQEAQAACRDLLDANFIQEGLRYQKDLAAAIFQHQDGHPVVRYTQLRDRRTWKARFFGTAAMTTILRESSPLTRSGNQFRFIHRSILEYLYSRVISDPIDPQQLSEETEPSSVESSGSFVGHSLNQRSIIGEPLIMQFLAERVDLDPLFKARLHDVIEDSKVDAQVSQAASNAISILVKAGVLFNGADLRGIRIPGATLRGAQFDSADLEGANLRGVNLSGTWLRQATLSNTQMSEVQFEELPYIKIGMAVLRCAFSANGEYLAVATRGRKIFIYNTSTWTRIKDFPGGPAFAISPTTSKLAKSGECNTVELGNISIGGAKVVLVGHSDWISEISYSPDGNQVATSSDDTTIRLWDVLTGDTVQLLRGHSYAVNCVAFSPTGLQVVSGGEDLTVRVWSAQTGDQVFFVRNHMFGVNCVAYSPDGHRIASGDSWGAVVMAAKSPPVVQISLFASEILTMTILSRYFLVMQE
ncbi:hypothetical protein BGZ97_006832 [Linnemannia gamsii]|uniref:NACHT domain-containing protein n=1 Tax=Linnemannia gamsii TaxID=64522 RepID=A0A9P6UFK6_9FUNG|nr:hypothetical protein BGZ97_006832 [Linnemannia gamsii]